MPKPALLTEKQRLALTGKLPKNCTMQDIEQLAKKTKHLKSNVLTWAKKDGKYTPKQRKLKGATGGESPSPYSVDLNKFKASEMKILLEIMERRDKALEAFDKANEDILEFKKDASAWIKANPAEETA